MDAAVERFLRGLRIVAKSTEAVESNCYASGTGDFEGEEPSFAAGPLMPEDAGAERGEV
jgi:hypothetical protein